MAFSSRLFKSRHVRLKSKTTHWSSFSSSPPGSWFGGADLILWRLLLAAHASAAGERRLQELAVRTPWGPTGEQRLYAGSQPGRFAPGGAGGHVGSTATLSARHLPGLRRSGRLLRRDKKRWVKGGNWSFISEVIRMWWGEVVSLVLTVFFLWNIWSWDTSVSYLQWRFFSVDISVLNSLCQALHQDVVELN